MLLSCSQTSVRVGSHLVIVIGRCLLVWEGTLLGLEVWVTDFCKVAKLD